MRGGGGGGGGSIKFLIMWGDPWDFDEIFNYEGCVLKFWVFGGRSKNFWIMGNGFTRSRIWLGGGGQIIRTLSFTKQFSF